MDRRLPLALSVVQQAIEEFRQDDKIDEAEMAGLATLMMEKQEDQEYSEEVRAREERSNELRRRVY